jgi:predicted nucleic acid-binding protein
MKTTVLIDSSVWVEVSREAGDQALKDEVAELIRDGRVAMTWPVWVEMNKGAKGPREEENLRGWREVSTWLAFDDACWSETAATARACQRSGVNVPSGDIMIFACAVRYGVELKELDRHFAMIRKAMKR